MRTHSGTVLHGVGVRICAQLQCFEYCCFRLDRWCGAAAGSDVRCQRARGPNGLPRTPSHAPSALQMIRFAGGPLPSLAPTLTVTHSWATTPFPSPVEKKILPIVSSSRFILPILFGLFALIHFFFLHPQLCKTLKEEIIIPNNGYYNRLCRSFAYQHLFLHN